jgi:hypothetical protein
MDTITQLQQNRRIILDLTSSTLGVLPGSFARLAFIASLRDLSTNTYDHPGLTAVYSLEAVQQALEQCHEEIFERILETPLSLQEEELRAYLKTMPAGLSTVASHWRKLEAYRALLPAEAPDYLKELFCSNIRAMLEILEKDSRVAPLAE